MDAFHSIWSKPSTQEHYKPEDFEILTTILSAILWKKHNGRIFMVCDFSVADFLYSKNLDFLWDDILPTLDKIPRSINEKTYWAAGKLFALSEFSAPIVGIDTDFLVWEKLEFKNPLYVIHREDLCQDSYPDLPEFLNFDESLDFSEKFLKLYTKTAIEFMSTHNTENYSLPHMLFAEQRLFSMCAKKLSLPITSLSELCDLFSEKNRIFTHLWGHKEILRKNPDLRKSYCDDCISRITAECPLLSSQHLERLRESLQSL